MKTKMCVGCLLIFVLLCGIAVGGLFLNAEHIKQPDMDENASNKQESSDDVVSEFEWSDIVISCLGDSITRGAYLTYSYPYCLQNELGTTTVNNYGISGNTLARNHSNYSTAMCVRYTEIAKNSDIIIVMGGVNDRGSIPLGTIDDTDITTFYGALNTLCMGLKENYPNTWIFFMTNFDYADSDTTNNYDVEYHNYYCTAVKEVCQKHNVDVFDTYNMIDFDTSKNTTDSVHPNQAFVGNRWVPAIAQYIKANYPGKTAA